MPGGVDPRGLAVKQIVLPHVAFARDMLAGETDRLPYPLVRRAQVAALPALPMGDSIEAPSYLMDLGLRRWPDPKRVFDGTLATNRSLAERWRRLAERQDDAVVMRVRQWEVGHCASQAISADLETMVQFTGDQAMASVLAGAIGSSVREIDSPRLAVACAATLCSEQPKTSMKLLSQASALVTDPVSKFLVGLRLAALSIKRLKDYDLANNLLKQLSTMGVAAVAGHVVSEADGHAMRALILNLQALVEVQQGQMLDAVDTMDKAANIMPPDGFVRVTRDMADRYRSQVRANVAQALWLAGQESKAVARINEHSSITRREHPYSLSEALTVAAFFNELARGHTLALSYCHEAERLLVREGAPGRLANCRRIAVVALNGMGKTARAQKLARAIPKDPMGERILV